MALTFAISTLDSWITLGSVAWILGALLFVALGWSSKRADAIELPRLGRKSTCQVYRLDDYRNHTDLCFECGGPIEEPRRRLGALRCAGCGGGQPA